MSVIKSSFRKVRSTFNWIQNLIFYSVSAGLGVCGILFLNLSMSELASGKGVLWLSLFMAVLGLICLGFPLLIAWEWLRDRQLSRWLADHAEDLGEGIEGPGGVVYNLDTELVRYEANLSLIVVSMGFKSGFYLRGSNHLLPMTLYTLFTLIFGWWTYDWQV